MNSECKFPRCDCAKSRLGCAHEVYDMIKPHNVVKKVPRKFVPFKPLFFMIEGKNRRASWD